MVTNIVGMVRRILLLAYVYNWTMSVNLYKNLIIIVSLIVTVGLYLIIRLWPYGINHTFSQHIARHKLAIVYYILLFLLILPLLLTYTFKWFIPTFKPSSWFGLFIILASVSHFTCTLVPETGRTKTIVHQTLAYLSANCLLPATLLIIFTPSISSIGRLVATFTSLVMAIIIVIFVRAYIKNKGQHKYLLVLQGSYFALFFMTLLVVTYIR